MKIEDASLKDLVFSLFLMLFFCGAAIFVGIMQQRKLGLAWIILLTVIGVTRMLLAIYRKLHSSSK